MKIELEYPYNRYTGYLITHKDGTKKIHLIDFESAKETSVGYARYLMAVKEKRFLDKNEVVTNIDKDKTNYDLSNLQIVNFKERARKYRKESATTQKMVYLLCPNCQKLFERRLGQTHLQKGGKITACSRKCARIIEKKNLSLEEKLEIGNNQILSIYRK